jgi:hypothetical protein
VKRAVRNVTHQTYTYTQPTLSEHFLPGGASTCGIGYGCACYDGFYGTQLRDVKNLAQEYPPVNVNTF